MYLIFIVPIRFGSQAKQGTNPPLHKLTILISILINYFQNQLRLDTVIEDDTKENGGDNSSGGASLPRCAFLLGLATGPT